MHPYGTRSSELEAEGLGPLLDRCVSRLEGAFRIALPRGRTRGLRCMFHLWEPLRTIYRWGGGGWGPGAGARVAGLERVLGAHKDNRPS